MLFALLLSGIAACGQPDVSEPKPAMPDPSLLETPVQESLPPLSEAALETQAAILETTRRDSLRRFARLADTYSGFASNFAGVDHHDHWSLLRRTGVDPLREIETLFEDRYTKRTIGSDIWFIWPDFAAMAPEDLIPERLSFQDRARLQKLVGEEGIAQIRAGSPYPGFRTAISQSGQWVYYLHEIGESETIE